LPASSPSGIDKRLHVLARGEQTPDEVFDPLAPAINERRSSPSTQWPPCDDERAQALEFRTHAILLCGDVLEIAAVRYADRRRAVGLRLRLDPISIIAGGRRGA
jgi:hypothetical protein